MMDNGTQHLRPFDSIDQIVKMLSDHKRHDLKNFLLIKESMINDELIVTSVNLERYLHDHSNDNVDIVRDLDKKTKEDTHRLHSAAVRNMVQGEIYMLNKLQDIVGNPPYPPFSTNVAYALKITSVSYPSRNDEYSGFVVRDKYECLILKEKLKDHAMVVDLLKQKPIITKDNLSMINLYETYKMAHDVKRTYCIDPTNRGDRSVTCEVITVIVKCFNPNDYFNKITKLQSKYGRKITYTKHYVVVSHDKRLLKYKYGFCSTDHSVLLYISNDMRNSRSDVQDLTEDIIKAAKFSTMHQARKFISRYAMRMSEYVSSCKIETIYTLYVPSRNFTSIDIDKHMKKSIYDEIVINSND